MTRRQHGHISSVLGQFGAVPVKVLARLRGEHVAAHLYAWIAARYANSAGKAWPKRETLAQDLGVSVKSIERALDVLRVNGLLTTSRRHHAVDGHVTGLNYELIYAAVQPPPKRHQSRSGKRQNHSGKQPKRHPRRFGQSDKKRGAKATPVSLHIERKNQIHRTRSKRESKAAAPPALPFTTDPEPEARSPKPADGDPIEAFQAAWNELTTEPIARCQELTPKRRRLIRARLLDRPLDVWREIFARIERSSFLHRNERGWVALDWFIAGPDAAVKVLEGNYDDRAKAERAPTPKELDTAQQMRRAIGGCRHEPRCVDYAACLRRFVRRLRGEEAA